MRRESRSVAIARKQPGDVGLRYGDLMPALDPDTGGNILVALQRTTEKPLGSWSTNYSKEELLLLLLPGPDYSSRRRGDTGRHILLALQRTAEKPLGSWSTNYNKERVLLMSLPGPDHRSRRRGDTGGNIPAALQQTTEKPIGSW